MAVCLEPWQWQQGLVQACPRLGLLGPLAWLALVQRQPPLGVLPQNHWSEVAAVQTACPAVAIAAAAAVMEMQPHLRQGLLWASGS